MTADELDEMRGRVWTRFLPDGPAGPLSRGDLINAGECGESGGGL